uniref:Putative secreted protein n=1 Tax=Anopheles darlingi TaxID=43151 RepID=A0A2M4DRR4_ANODA
MIMIFLSISSPFSLSLSLCGKRGKEQTKRIFRGGGCGEDARSTVFGARRVMFELLFFDDFAATTKKLALDGGQHTRAHTHETHLWNPAAVVVVFGRMTFFCRER